MSSGDGGEVEMGGGWGEGGGREVAGHKGR